jgi:rhomboid protease GluP
MNAKTKFQNALTWKMIERNNFMPYKDEDGKMLIDSNINILTNYSSSYSVIVEIVDGDELDCGQISGGLQRNVAMLTEMKAPVAQYFFKVFIFDAEPEKGKTDAMANAEVHNVYEKKYLKSISVNLRDGQMKKHYEAKISDMGLTKTISELVDAKVLNNINVEEININEIKALAEKKEKEYYLETKTKAPIATYSLIAINILVGVLIYLYSLKSGTSYSQLLYDFGAKVTDKIIAGEYYRFITPIFLHAGVTHLLINCFSLYAVGTSVEIIYGRTKFLIVYMIAGIMGNVASFMFSPSWGVGASGAIFGLLGALLYFGIERPALFKKLFGYNIIITIIINLGYGFSTTGIDNFAHIGGLIGGFLALGMISNPEKPRWYLNRILYFVLIIILFVSGITYGFNNDQSKLVSKVAELTKYEKASDWNNAETTAIQILELKPTDNSIKSSVLWVLTKAEAIKGKNAEAIKYGEMLKEVDPANGHFLLGLIYYDMQNYVLSKTELLEAQKAGATYEQISKILKEIK